MNVETANNWPARVSSATVMVEAMDESFSNMMDVFPKGGRITRVASGKISRRMITGWGMPSDCAASISERSTDAKPARKFSA